MAKVLIVNASARKERSLSRFMTNVFAETWKNKHPDDKISYREVGQAPVPHVTEAWIAGAFKPPALRTAEDLEALKVSDELVAELKETDVIVLGTPMYNWSVPSALKAYIDQVLRVNETVLISSDNPRNPYQGLLKDKKVYLLMARGNNGYDPGDFYEYMDFQTNYLKTVFRIMGIEDITDLAINGVGLVQESLDFATAKVAGLIRN
ncbi:FMN-dependent NADH-azoreductase [Taibaiella chishuiensis]|uniref:FMN dependent NADH:quinone oxidoreductase n=1 Tax=Taibaiella chishuiensis TaxID=1434707 RepID=A0A2P8DBM3_9BACT|nr:NAD(P)H-dependent oxidoreductase [Taibaiella chishuiensis]PSK94633.1 FMN-dependent NADH-azoreductase [Taibaiella chishuiensis]